MSIFAVLPDGGILLRIIALAIFGLAVADYFTPNNADYLQAHDQDAGSGGVILLPDQPGNFPHLLVGGGKPSVLCAALWRRRTC